MSGSSADFNPTLPPVGRLARLGVVIEAEQSNRDQVAILCDRAGIASVWLSDGSVERSDGVSDFWTWVTELSTRLTSASLGVMVEASPETTRLAGLGSSIELSVRTKTSRKPTRVRRFSAVVDDLDELGDTLMTVDDVCLPAWAFDDLETASDELRARCASQGRDPGTLGVAALVPVSIGRTETEASARADADPVFARIGHPRDVGIFGTLEECQDRVIALAHAGITDVRAILPQAPDVHDVIAQLTAMTIGTTDVLVPGSLRSAAPAPPVGWGGRPDVPIAPRISGGSKRR